VNFRNLSMVFVFLAISAFAKAKSAVPNIAVIDFTGDRTVETEQLQFISGKMATELVETHAFQVLDRSRMDFILKEQGFQQSGACSSSDCRVQVGQLLGVDYLVAGSLVKFGPTYMLRLDYLDVGSGRIVNSVDLQMEGELYQIVNDLCKDGANKLLAALRSGQNPSVSPTVPADALPRASGKPMAVKRKIALALLGTSLVGGGAGFYFNSAGDGYMTDFGNAKTAKDSIALRRANSNISSASTDRNVSYGVSVGSLIIGLALWFWPEGGK